ncbi:MAG TPA: lactate utilization protein C [Burkholderiales bacterium]|nr:lactate utilization protein C [Burkholderiales bacterium]
MFPMSARERMLARIRERQGKPAVPDAQELETVRAHVARHPRNPAPRDEWDPLNRFRERALSLASTVDEAESFAHAPARVADYLRARALPMSAVCWRELLELDWRGNGIEVASRSARGDDLVGITGACCAIAETGTLVMLSGPGTPPSVSLLPETHIALVRRTSVLRSMEDAWVRVRAAEDALPRAVTFISGPSRTADIEQTVTLGAHGPYRVHIIVIAD